MHARARPCADGQTVRDGGLYSRGGGAEVRDQSHDRPPSQLPVWGRTRTQSQELLWMLHYAVCAIKAAAGWQGCAGAPGCLCLLRSRVERARLIKGFVNFLFNLTVMNEAAEPVAAQEAVSTRDDPEGPTGRLR